MSGIVYGQLGPKDRTPASTEAPSIVVENLVKDFKGCRAVDDVSFNVARGASIGLVGANGAGKTTTLLSLLGLVSPTSGRVTVFGEDMRRRPRKVLGRMNFASPYMTIPGQLTLRQNLTFFGRIYGVRNLAARIGQLAWDFGLGEMLDRTVGTFSAGQKTRAALIKALLNEPDILLLDEPTASLDPERAAFVHDLIEAHRSKMRASILIASHNMAEVDRLCDLVLVMGRGRILEAGTPKDITTRHGFDHLYDAVQFISWPRDVSNTSSAA